MLYSKKILPIFISSILLGSTASFADQHMVGFESSEHITAGNKVKIFFNANEPGKQGYIFHFPNGVQLSYGEMVSMGDFYEVLGKPISTAGTEAERRANFIGAFNLVTNDSATYVEIPKILGIVKSEQAAVEEGLKHGEKPEDVYNRIGGDDNRLWNCITGGGCNSTWYLKPGRYLKLEKQDFDHFGAFALTTYHTGHQLALEKAVAAHATHDVQQLETAYAMDAYAAHFLSDRFAAGHIRVPRAELPNAVTPRDIGNVLVADMHDEDNAFGLHVHNARGDHWVAFGDKRYADEANKTNRAILDEAMQNSVNEIFAAYQSGEMPAVDTVSNLIPQLDEVKNLGTQDIAPLFYWDEKTNKVYRRSDVNSPYNRSWTTNWWGWMTVLMLHKNRPLTAEQQAQLVMSGLGDQAMQYGLITDKNVAMVLKKNK